MQMQWVNNSTVFHYGSEFDYPIQAKTLSFNAIRKISRVGGNTFVAHEQGSLVYLLFSIVCSMFYRKKNNFAYDIHDIMYFPNIKYVDVFVFLKKSINLILERIVFALPFIKLMSVTEGLSEYYYRRYGKRPAVVRNVSVPITFPRVRKFPSKLAAVKFVYFGFPTIFPFHLLDSIRLLGIVINYYGPALESMKKNDIFCQGYGSAYAMYERNKDLIIQHGEFNQDDLSFLVEYDMLVISDNERSSNIKWSLPNKIFQALAHGMSVLAIGDFEEARNFFSPLNTMIYFNSNRIVEFEYMVELLISLRTSLHEDDCRNYFSNMYAGSRKTYNEIMSAS